MEKEREVTTEVQLDPAHQGKHVQGEHHKRNRAPNVYKYVKAKDGEIPTSVLRIPNLKSVFLVILSLPSSFLTLSTKLGHPDPESYFFLLENRAVPQQTHS